MTASAIPKNLTAARPIETTHTAPVPGLADPLKVLATLGIIWIHVPQSRIGIATTCVARFAVPFFVAISVFFVIHSAMTKPSRSWTDYTWLRLRRIYIPFLAWNAIYLAFKAMKWCIARNEPNDFPGWEILWLGAAYHLWFLPFILVVSLFFFAIAHGIRRIPSISVLVSGLLGLAGWSLALQVDRLESTPMLDGARYMLQAIPAAFLAAAFAIVYCRGAWRQWTESLAVLVALALFTLCQLISASRERVTLVECLSGVALLLIACGGQSSAGFRSFQRLAPYTYGIYLCHLLIIKTLETAYHKLHWGPSLSLDLLTFTLTIVGSLATVAVFRRSPYLRWLVE